MKKTTLFLPILLTLLAVLLFTSCDISDLIFKRAIITESEWYENMQLTNYTINIKEGNEHITVMAADSLFKIQNDIQISVFDFESGLNYVKSSMGWIATEFDDSVSEEWIKLGFNQYMPKISFDEVSYNDEKRAYTIVNNYISGELYFQEGVLTHAKFSLYDNKIFKQIQITDIGKTTIEVGEYTVIGQGTVSPNDADEDAITTVTKEEWWKIANAKNYTINAYFNVLGTQLSKVEVKATNSSMKTSVSVMGNLEITYYTLADGISYKITRQSNGKYVADLDEYKPKTLLALTEYDLIFEDFIYNENGRYYFANTKEETVYLYFDNSNLTKIIIIPSKKSDSGVGEIICAIKDLGTTEIDIPKYEIIDSKVELTYELNSDETGYIVKGMGANEGVNITIPSVYNGLPVVGIAENAFRHKNIIRVVIPDSVVDIAPYAFAYCRLLTSVTIGNSVANIGNFAFIQCESLKNIEIPDSVITIGKSAFKGCSNLKSVIVGDSVKNIGDSAFYGCLALENIQFGKSVQYLGNEVFVNNKKLKSITISNSVLNIGDKVFKDCINLENIILGDSVKILGYQVFEGCTALSSIIIPKSVEYTGSYLFLYCDSIQIYCEADEKPIGWSQLWNKNVVSDVIWGYMTEE